MFLENISVGIGVGLLALVAASIVDVKIREVPDWISYALIAFAIGYAIILSVFHGTWGFIINSLAGLIVGVAVGMLMFYSGQWGGGDSKLVMGIGAILGIPLPAWSSIHGNYELLYFLAATVFCGAIYGLLFSAYKGAKNFKACKEEAKKRLSTRYMKYVRISLASLLAASLIFHLVYMTLDSLIFFTLSIFLAAAFYAWTFLKTVENVCMIKEISTSKLTEGDWLSEPVMKAGKEIVAKSKIGLTKEEIDKIKANKIKSVIVKEGMPFVPSFLIAYIIMLVVQAYLA